MMFAAILTLAVLGLSDDPEGVVQTAPAGTQSVAEHAEAPTAPAPTAADAQAAGPQDQPHGLTTDQQIQRFLAAGATPRDERRHGGPVLWDDDREIHGHVEGAIGTGGYRSYGASISVPIGESGRVSFRFSQTENGFGYYGDYPYDGYYPYDAGYSPGLSDDRHLGYGFRTRTEDGWGSPRRPMQFDRDRTSPDPSSLDAID